MHDQVLHLLFASSRPQSVIRVVPASASLVGTLGGSFMLMEYAAHPALAYVENRTTSLFLEDTEDLITYRWMVDKLAEIALDGGTIAGVACPAGKRVRPSGGRLQ